MKGLFRFGSLYVYISTLSSLIVITVVLTFNIFQMVKKSPTKCWIVAGQWIHYYPSQILLSAVHKIFRRRLQYVLPWWNVRKWWVVVFLLSSLIQSFIIPITFNFSSLCSWTFASWYDGQEFCWSKHLLSQLCSSSSY